MDNYIDYYNKIKDYLNKDDIISNKNIISAYDISCILDDFFKNIVELLSASKIVNCINNEIINKDSPFNKGLSNGKGILKKHNYICDDVIFYNDGIQYSCGIIFSDLKTQERKNKSIFLGKKYNACEDEIFLENNYFASNFNYQYFISKLIVNNIDLFKDYFIKLDYYQQFFKKRVGWLFGSKYTITDGIFDVNISYNATTCSDKKFFVEYSTNKEFDPNNIFNDKFIDGSCLRNVIDLNTILKKMPINIDSLDDELKNIIYSYINKNNVKVKSLTK